MWTRTLLLCCALTTTVAWWHSNNRRPAEPGRIWGPHRLLGNGSCVGDADKIQNDCGYPTSQMALDCSDFTDDNSDSPGYHTHTSADGQRCWYMSQGVGNDSEARQACRGIRTNGRCYHYDTHDIIEFTKRGRLANFCSKAELRQVAKEIIIGTPVKPGPAMRVGAYQQPDSSPPKNWFWYDSKSAVDADLWSRTSNEPNDASGDERCSTVQSDDDGLSDSVCDTPMTYLCVVDLCTNCDEAI